MYYQFAQYKYYGGDIVPYMYDLAAFRAEATSKSEVYNDNVTYSGINITIHREAVEGYYTHVFVWSSDPDEVGADVYTNVYRIDKAHRSGAASWYYDCVFAAAWTHAINVRNREYIAELLTERYSAVDSSVISLTQESYIDSLDLIPGVTTSPLTAVTDYSLIYVCSVHPADGIPIGNKLSDVVPISMTYDAVVSPPYTLLHKYRGNHTGQEKIADLVREFQDVVHSCGSNANRILRAQIVPTAVLQHLQDFNLYLNIGGGLDLVDTVSIVTPITRSADLLSLRTNIDPIGSGYAYDHKALCYDSTFYVKVSGVVTAKIERSTITNTNGMSVSLGYTLSSGLSFYVAFNDADQTRVPVNFAEIVAYGDYYSEYVRQNQGMLQSQNTTAILSAISGIAVAVGGIVTGGTALPVLLGVTSAASSAVSLTNNYAQQKQQIRNAMTQGTVSSGGSAQSAGDGSVSLLTITQWRPDRYDTVPYLRRYGYAYTKRFTSIPAAALGGRRNYTYIRGDLVNYRPVIDSYTRLSDLTVTVDELYDSFRSDLARGVFYWHPQSPTTAKPGDVDTLSNPY